MATFTKQQAENFIRFVTIWATDSESQNKSFKRFLRDEAVAGIENCTDIETGFLHIEEAKQLLQTIEDAEFLFDMMQSEGESQESDEDE